MFFVFIAIYSKRKDTDRIGLIEGFLARRIKKAQAFQCIAEKFQTERLFIVYGKYIDNITAHRKMAPPFDHIDPFISVICQAPEQRFPFVILPGRYVKRCCIDMFRRRDELGRFFYRRDDGTKSMTAECCQYFHLPGCPFHALCRR